jgi:hypothetical protein
VGGTGPAEETALAIGRGARCGGGGGGEGAGEEEDEKRWRSRSRRREERRRQGSWRKSLRMTPVGGAAGAAGCMGSARISAAGEEGEKFADIGVETGQLYWCV